MCVHMDVIHRVWVMKESLRMASTHGCTQHRVSHEPQTRKEAEWEARAGRESLGCESWQSSLEAVRWLETSLLPSHWCPHLASPGTWQRVPRRPAAGRGPLITAGCGALQKEMLVNRFSFLLCSKELFQKMLSRSVFLAANTQLLFHFKVFIKSNYF